MKIIKMFKKGFIVITAFSLLLLLSLGILFKPLVNVGASAYDFEVINTIYGLTTQDGEPSLYSPVALNGRTELIYSYNNNTYEIPIKDTEGTVHILDGFSGHYDYIDVSNGKLIKNTGRLVLNGSEEWSRINSAYDGIIACKITSFVPGIYAEKYTICVLSDSFVGMSAIKAHDFRNREGIYSYVEGGPSNLGFVVSISKSMLSINWENATNSQIISSFKSLLADNEIEVVYILSEPVEYNLSVETMSKLLTADSNLRLSGTNPFVNKLDAPFLSLNADGLCSWAAIANADRYAYVLDNGTTGFTEELSIQLEKGQTIKVMAITDSEYFTNSEYSTITSFGKSNGFLNFFENGFSKVFGDDVDPSAIVVGLLVVIVGIAIVKKILK